MDGTALKPFRSKGTAKHRTYRKARTIHVQRREPFHRLFSYVEIGGFLEQEQGLEVQVISKVF